MDTSISNVRCQISYFSYTWKLNHNSKIVCVWTFLPLFIWDSFISQFLYTWPMSIIQQNAELTCYNKKTFERSMSIILCRESTYGSLQWRVTWIWSQELRVHQPGQLRIHRISDPTPESDCWNDRTSVSLWWLRWQERVLPEAKPAVFSFLCRAGWFIS